MKIHEAKEILIKRLKEIHAHELTFYSDGFNDPARAITVKRHARELKELTDIITPL